MALVCAEPLDGRSLPALQGEGPHLCTALLPWRGRRFRLPPAQPFLAGIHEGGSAPEPALDNLVGAAKAWQEHPDWMDQLDPASPVFSDKQMERDLYLDRWAPHLSPGMRVLDLGGGVGRFAQWLLGQDCTVELVDPDLRSLWCAMDRLAGGPGRLDLHWSTGTDLGPLAPVDCALAVELLCYVPDPAAVLREIRRLLRPGGLLLLSVEADQGASEDGVLHVPGDRWVQTYSADSLRALLSDWEILQLEPSHYVLSGPLEDQAQGLDLDDIRAIEQLARGDPKLREQHRAWTAVVR